MTDARTIESLDGLRGVAALMVVASHGAASGMHLIPGVSLEGIGKHGVYLFFVLSAFLLTRQALLWPRGQQWWLAARSYFIRRFARIAPLYLTVLLAAWLLGGPGLGVPIDTESLVRHVLLLEGRGIYWSIPVEFLYYFWIPLLALWLTSRFPTGARGCALIGLLVVCVWVFPAAAAPANSDQLRWYLPVLLCGTLAAWVSGNLLERPVQPSPWCDVLFMVVLVGSTPALFGLSADAWHRSFLVWGLLWGGLILAAQRGAFLLLQRLLVSQVMRALGRWCFGLYLLHLPAQAIARRAPFWPELQAWLGLAFAVALAALAYRCIERPSLSIANAYERSLRR